MFMARSDAIEPLVLQSSSRDVDRDLGDDTALPFPQSPDCGQRLFEHDPVDGGDHVEILGHVEEMPAGGRMPSIG